MQLIRLTPLLAIPTFCLAGNYCSAAACNAIVEIQQTLDLFPMAVDNKNYSILADVFAPNATADFVVIPIAHGLQAIQSGLQKSLQGLVSQHNLTTQSITIHSDREASAITYLAGTFFGQKNLTGQVVTTYGQYIDSLTYLNGVGWRVSDRTLSVTATIGNVNILQF